MGLSLIADRVVSGQRSIRSKTGRLSDSGDYRDPVLLQGPCNHAAWGRCRNSIFRRAAGSMVSGRYPGCCLADRWLVPSETQSGFRTKEKPEENGMTFKPAASVLHASPPRLIFAAYPVVCVFHRCFQCKALNQQRAVRERVFISVSEHTDSIPIIRDT